MPTLKLAGGFPEWLESLLAALAHCPPEAADEILRLLETDAEAIRVETDERPATDATEVIVRFHPGERLRAAVAASGALQVDPGLSEHFHLRSLSERG
jgi:hypothetical protein